MGFVINPYITRFFVGEMGRNGNSGLGRFVFGLAWSIVSVVVLTQVWLYIYIPHYISRFPLFGKLFSHSSFYTSFWKSLNAFIEASLFEKRGHDLSRCLSIPYSWIGRIVFFESFLLSATT